MKIQKGGGPKGPAKITPSTPSPTMSYEPYFEWMRDFERSMTRRFYEFFAPWRMEFPETPHCEMQETEKGYVVSVAMPGFEEREIEVRVQPWRLYLHAKHEETKEKKGEPAFQEHREFTRWIEFPAEVNPENVNAVLSKGVLEVTLEKAQTARKIEVHTKAA
jgi:HSP20 family molecular chaperone IbpA